MSDPTLTAEVVALDDDSIEAVYERAADLGWIDGLPIIPPTPDRVKRMMAGVNREPQDNVANIPPNNAPATIEKIAINAVMAGCKPEYMPVVVAAIEACADPQFNLYALNTTTSSVGQLVIVNGPIRNELEINCGYSVFGGANARANTTIGRAVRLVMRNVGGSIEGIVSKSTMGNPLRITGCVGEWEEQSPWPALSVQRGLAEGQDAVTVFGAQGTLNLQDVSCKTAAGLLTVLAHSIDCSATNMVLGKLESAQVLLALCPDFAYIVARDGWSVEDARQFIFEQTQRGPPRPLARRAARAHGRARAHRQRRRPHGGGPRSVPHHRQRRPRRAPRHRVPLLRGDGRGDPPHRAVARAQDERGG